MKKIFLMAIVAVFSFTSCEDFLDSENYTEANSSNYPVTTDDLNKELAALYGVLNQYTGYGSNQGLDSPWLINNIMSDDANGGGGTGDVAASAIDHLMSYGETMLDAAWHCTYVGIARANAIIASASSMEFDDTEARNQLLGEAYFMRGLFYLWGSQMWGNIPAYWEAAAPTPCPQQDAETVIYPHILADFLSAANLMTHGYTTMGDGHATKGAAEGYLARAYMFYEGFYKKVGELATAVPDTIVFDFVQEGCDEKLHKGKVIELLEDCINNSGYKLLSDYRLLWQYTNKLTSDDGYEFVSDLKSQGLYWGETSDGNGNGNAEEMFQIQYMNSGTWNGNTGMGFINYLGLNCGLRSSTDAEGRANGGEEHFPFGQGWGWGVYNPNLWDDWSDSDIRKTATMMNGCSDKNGGTQEIAVYFITDCAEETALYNKKVMSIRCKEAYKYTESDAYTWWGVYRKNNTSSSATSGNSMQCDHYADYPLLRFADVLLMHSELTGDATNMNKVRKRAGLSEVSYSWANIKAERRFELAGEGLRFNDLRRWSGKDGGTTCEAAVALERQNGARVNYCGTWTKMKHATVGWAQRYADTDGFLRIPPTQISAVADETVLTQNPGWLESEASEWVMSAPPTL